MFEGYDLIKTKEWEIWGYRTCQYTGFGSPIGFDDKRRREFNAEISKAKGFEIGRYFGKKESVKVPSVIEGCQIMGINGSVFHDLICDHYEPCSTLRNIEIDEGIRFLDDGMFESYRNLSNVKLPDSIVYIGTRCFQNTPIKRIRFPKSAIYVPSDCFTECVELQDVILQEGLEYIAYCAFRKCEKLKHIGIPSTVKWIDDGAFLESGLQNIAIPEGVTEIRDCAFEDCFDLRSCVIPKSVHFIGKDVFSLRIQQEDGKWIAMNNPNLTLYVYPGSYALMWAREHGYKVANAEI